MSQSKALWESKASKKSWEDDAHCRLSLRFLLGKYDREEQGGRPVILQCEGCHGTRDEGIFFLLLTPLEETAGGQDGSGSQSEPHKCRSGDRKTFEAMDGCLARAGSWLLCET